MAELGECQLSPQAVIDWLYDYARELRQQPKQGLYVGTVHSAKGLEFRHVILLDGIVERDFQGEVLPALDKRYLQLSLKDIDLDFAGRQPPGASMLHAEAAGEPYNKSEHNQALRRQLNGRSKSSVELKHQNISAVLDALGLPYINGYKPRGNSQLLLRKSVQAYVLEHQQLVGTIVDALEEVKLPGEKTYLAALVEPPTRDALVRVPSTVRNRMPRKFDYAARDEANRKLGRAGEQWVIEFEQQRLTDLDRAELFQRLDWVSDTQGDGAGFDILSFEDEEQHRFIEVKTTNGGVGSSFLVSHNELAFSREVGEQFYLYRVFQFRDGPRLFTLSGDLGQHVHLKPTDYRASFRGVVG